MGRPAKGNKSQMISIPPETQELLHKHKEGTISDTVVNALDYYFWDKLLDDETKEKARAASTLRKHKIKLVGIGEQIDVLTEQQEIEAALVSIWKTKCKKLGIKGMWDD